MLCSLGLALLLAPARPLPRIDSYAPCKEAFTNLVKSIGDLEKNPRFHYGASLMAASLRGNGGFRYTITSHEEAEHAIIMAGDESADVLGLDVLDSNKKSVVTKREKAKGRVAITFNAKNGAGYVVVVRNLTKETDAFVALGILVENKGVPISLGSIRKASNRIADAIQEGFGKGYALIPDKCTFVGCMLSPSKPLAANFPGVDRWTQIMTTDVDPLTVNAAFIDAKKGDVQPEGISDGASRFYEFKKSSVGLTMTNTGSKNQFIITGILG